MTITSLHPGRITALVVSEHVLAYDTIAGAAVGVPVDVDARDGHAARSLVLGTRDAARAPEAVSVATSSGVRGIDITSGYGDGNDVDNDVTEMAR